MTTSVAIEIRKGSELVGSRDIIVWAHLLLGHGSSLVLQSDLAGLRQLAHVAGGPGAEVPLGVDMVAREVADSVSEAELAEELSADELMVLSSAAVHAHRVPSLQAEQVAYIVKEARELQVDE